MASTWNSEVTLQNSSRLLVILVAVSACIPALPSQTPPNPVTAGMPAPQSAAAQQSTVEEKRCTIAGQVVNSVSGEPVRKAQLSLRKSVGSGYGMRIGRAAISMYAAVTDAAGKFRIDKIEPGTYVLSCERPGFLGGEYGASNPMRAGMPLKIAAGQELKDLTFKLIPQSAVSGRVVDEEGEPFQHAEVGLAQEHYLLGRRQLITVKSQTTNDRGEYRVHDLDPGKYLVYAMPGHSYQPPPRQPDDTSPETGFVPTFYPGVSEASQALRIDVSPGAEVHGIDLRLIKTRVYRISGKLVDSTTGKPTQRLSLWLMDQMIGGGPYAAVKNPEGKFEFTHVPPGSYLLLCDTDPPQQPTMLQKLEVTNDIEGLVVHTVHTQPIEGTIMIEGADKADLSQMRLALMPTGRIFHPFNQKAVQVKADGTFRSSPVRTGKYELNCVGGPEGSYVVAVKSGDQTYQVPELDFSAYVPSSIQIILSLKGGEVNGHVRSKDGPAAGAIVALVPEPSRRAYTTIYKAAITDQAGSFSIKGVVPGAYKAFAWEDMELGAFQDPEFIKPVEDQGMKVTVDKGSTTSLDLELVRPAQ